MPEQRIMDGGWRLLFDDPQASKAVWIYDDAEKTVIKTVYYATEELFDFNAARMNASLNERWGDGRVAASVPLNVYFQHLAQAQTEGDQAYVRRFLNDPDNAKFRTFKGKI
jgi:hypothetical protein